MNTQAVAPSPARDARTLVSTLIAPVAPIRRAAEPRPNAPCPCGSGRKAKKCCALDHHVEHARPAAVRSAAVPAAGTPASRWQEPPAAQEDARPTDASVIGQASRLSVPCPAQPAPDLANDAHSGAHALACEPMPSCDMPSNSSPLSSEGTGCAAWMRLSGLYPWKPLSMAERRAGLEKLTRYTRHWMNIRKASGSFRPLLSPEHARAESRAVMGQASRLSGACPAQPSLETVAPAETSPSNFAEASETTATAAHDSEDLLFETLRDARTLAEPSYELADALEMSEAKLNQLCREATGLSAREWWDVLRAEDAAKAIRAEIEAALDGVVLDRSAQIRRRGVQFMDLHRVLRQHRRAHGSSAADRAWNLGFKNAARLNLALWRATGQSMQELEASILREIFATWSFNHQTCRLCAKNADGVVHHGDHRAHRERHERMGTHEAIGDLRDARGAHARIA